MRLHGISPYATASISYSGSTEGISSGSFFCDASGALANGDQAAVKFDESMLDSLGREHGLVPSQMEKTYEVSGLDKYLESIDEIPDELFHEMDSTAQQAEYDFFSTRVDDFQLNSLEYIGGAMRMTKAGAEDSYRLQDSAGELSSNTAFLLYRGTVSGKAGSDYASNAPETFYFSYMFGSVVKAVDGTVSFDSEKQGIRGFDVQFLAFHGDNSIVAYQELMEFYIKYLFGADLYEFSCTGELEGFNSAKFAGRLSDIPGEIKGQLQEKAFVIRTI